MKDVLASALEVAGLAVLCIAAFNFGVVAGLVAVGLALTLIGVALEVR